VEVGQNVQPGQEMMKVIPLEEGDLWVTANFKETQLAKMKPGLPAEIAVDATGKTYKGRVDSIAGASGARFSLLPPENATGNYVKVVQRPRDTSSAPECLWCRRSGPNSYEPRATTFDHRMYVRSQPVARSSKRRLR
jgi:hypothetical protein